MQQPESFKKYIDAFESKLASIIVDDISPEPYCKRYLNHLLSHKRYYLEIYSDVLQKLLLHSTKRKEDTSLVDFGAGNGLLGIFAKFCGFKKVFLNDIDAKFVLASKELSAKLNVHPDGFITGDIDKLVFECKGENIDAVIGTDVIEHIYDLDEFLSGVKELNPNMVTVFTTASNPSNFIKVRALRKIQLRDELIGGEPSEHALFGEHSLEPFLEIRKELINKKFPGLAAADLASLAIASRGLREDDIYKAVDTYRSEGKLPVPAEGTNTSNPLNGSWTERILPIESYISYYGHAGFTCVFYAGFYNEYGSGFGSFAKKLLNAAITVFGKKISPYIVIVGYKK